MKSALASFQTLPLKDAARQLLAKLGYKSDKFLVGAGSKPQDFLVDFATGHPFDEAKALVSEWKSADILFQLTDQELSRESSLFTDNSVQRSLLKSYIFIAIELKGAEYGRGKFSAIARQINRLFPMPVMVLFKHVDQLTIAVINRRRNKLDDNKDVLEKATLIRDISLANPHRGHLDILASLTLSELKHPHKLPITDFDTLHSAWEQIFNVELLNERFYRELANWYFWALPQVEFPVDLEPDDEKRRATGLIRLLTRLIFCWFLKEKSLIPEKLFHPMDLAKLLKGFDPESETSSIYYQAILQNLFFATLNQRMGKDGNGKPYRRFAFDEGFLKNKSSHDLNNCFRYESLFKLEPDDALALFGEIPFLNGGLFECLDKRDEDKEKTFYLDGFSRNAKKRPHIPDRLFFDSGETADLSEVYGDKKRKSERVTGLITILNRYKFTIVENTPIDQEIALDPELLGKVFENLLASYNEETKTTARKQTGSFYTPRSIVDYMVDESLKAHLARALVERARMKEPEARAGLDLLFAYTEKEHAFNPAEVTTLITAIDEVKILDPACGSGAFPMGVLHKLVYLLSKLDRKNVEWEKLQIAKVQEITDTEERRRKLAEIASNFADNNDDYGRKLYLIENCLYGVDIQPIAIQITKLRFFISLVCDQKTNRNKKENHGIRPLPNLETKFVAADALIGLPEMTQSLLIDPRVGLIEREIASLYHSHFSIQRRDQKLTLQKKIKTLRQDLAKLLAESLMSPAKSKHVAEWDPFDPQSSADFFDPHWMFGRSLADGFDIVIGNPPYLQLSKTENITDSYKDRLKTRYKTSGGRFNTFIFFIHLAMETLKKHGTMSYIVPNTLLTQDYYHETRSLLLRNRMRSIVQYTKLPFENAVVENVTFVATRDESVKDYDISIFEDDLSDATLLAAKSRDSFLANRKAAMTIYAAAIMDEVFARELPTLSSFCHVNQAIALKGDRKLSLRSSNPDGEFFRLLDGRNIGRYQIKWDGVYFEYDESKIHSCKRQDIFLTAEKLLFRRVSEDLMFAYDDNQFFALNTLVVVNLREGQTESLKYLLALLNSSLMNYLYKKRFKSTKKVFSEIQARTVGQLPIKPSTGSAAKVLSTLVDLIILAKTDLNGAAAFLEDLIDACVMECYFHEHMADRDLLFHDTVAPHLAAYDPNASKAKQRDFLTQLHQTLNAPSHAVRNRLLRLTADSPELLAVIKAEGKV
jgi:adenine-specific DNA-methyltransferase